MACRIGDGAGVIGVGWIVVCQMDWMRWLERVRDGWARWRWW